MEKHILNLDSKEFEFVLRGLNERFIKLYRLADETHEPTYRKHLERTADEYSALYDKLFAQYEVEYLTK